MAEPGLGRAEGSTVVVPRLLSSSRSMWLAVGVAAAGALGVAGWGLGTQSGVNRAMAAVVGVVVLVLLVAIVWRRTWVDTAAGTVSRSVVGRRVAHVAWAEASTIDLEPNRAGQLALRVKGRGGAARITVLAIDAGGDRSLDPHLLRLLADQIATWAPARARVADALRAQADFVAAGGELRRSPLARRL